MHTTGLKGGEHGGGGGDAQHKEGQSSDEEEYWECLVCLEPIATSIIQCKEGHLMCGECHAKSNEVCPACGTSMAGTRNRALERLRDRLRKGNARKEREEEERAEAERREAERRRKEEEERKERERKEEERRKRERRKMEEEEERKEREKRKREEEEERREKRENERHKKEEKAREEKARQDKARQDRARQEKEEERARQEKEKRESIERLKEARRAYWARSFAYTLSWARDRNIQMRVAVCAGYCGRYFIRNGLTERIYTTTESFTYVILAASSAYLLSRVGDNFLHIIGVLIAGECILRCTEGFSERFYTAASTFLYRAALAAFACLLFWARQRSPLVQLVVFFVACNFSIFRLGFSEMSYTTIDIFPFFVWAAIIFLRPPEVWCSANGFILVHLLLASLLEFAGRLHLAGLVPFLGMGSIFPPLEAALYFGAFFSAPFLFVDYPTQLLTSRVGWIVMFLYMISFIFLPTFIFPDEDVAFFFPNMVLKFIDGILTFLELQGRKENPPAGVASQQSNKTRKVGGRGGSCCKGTLSRVTAALAGISGLWVFAMLVWKYDQIVRDEQGPMDQAIDTGSLGRSQHSAGDFFSKDVGGKGSCANRLDSESDKAQTCTDPVHSEQVEIVSNKLRASFVDMIEKQTQMAEAFVAVTGSAGSKRYMEHFEKKGGVRYWINRIESIDKAMRADIKMTKKGDFYHELGKVIDDFKELSPRVSQETHSASHAWKRVAAFQKKFEQASLSAKRYYAYSRDLRLGKDPDGDTHRDVLDEALLGHAKFKAMMERARRFLF